ncbi:MAG: hypothetical protein A2176_09915 [Spirochaetes bacterium RBG_13_51_14]|nr:MAG: hypothetical protein A2176_09915 [Spirochaetes bacterium RBG_13_51_14]
MNGNQEQLVNEYLRDLSLQGRPFMKVKSNLKILLAYLEGANIDFLRVKIRDAQDFQMYLTTAVHEEGNTCAERSGVLSLPKGRSIRYSKGSILTIIGSVTAFYDYLRKKKLVPANPFLEIIRIKQGKNLPKNILAEEKMDEFLRHLKEFWKGKDLIRRRSVYKAHVIAELMYSTGMRINEVMKLVPSDIDFLRGTVRITDTKSGQVREGILNEYAGKVLRIYIERTREYILFGKNDADMELLFGAKAHVKTWLNILLNQESHKLGLGRFTSHHFRHAVGYHLLKNGCDIRYIQEILGHRELSSTQVYTKVDKEDLKNVIDAYHPRRLNHPASPTAGAPEELERAVIVPSSPRAQSKGEAEV